MSTPDGQRNFMAELLGAMKATPRVPGVLYCDPVTIANPKPNTTLFDLKGRALPVLDIWKQFTS